MKIRNNFYCSKEEGYEVGTKWMIWGFLILLGKGFTKQMDSEMWIKVAVNKRTLIDSLMDRNWGACEKTGTDMHPHGPKLGCMRKNGY